MTKRIARYAGSLLALAGLLACTLFSDIAEGSGSWYVATTGNDSSDCLTAATACRTIQAAIDKAAPGGNIQIADGIYVGRVYVNKALRVLGASQAGTILDAGGGGSAMTIASDGPPGTEGLNVLVSKLTVRNGSSDRGAGVYIGGHALATLVLMDITNNTARIGGGLANDGQARISYVRIASNHASNRCGGVDNAGTLEMYRGEVSANTTDGYGGGLCNEAGAELTIRRANVVGNTAELFENVGGGGIYNVGQLGLYASLIDDNHARGNGGGIFDVGAMTISGVTLSRNETRQEGAAVFTCAGEIRNSAIVANTGNTAVFAKFGGFSESGPGVCENLEAFLLSNSTVSGNLHTGVSVQENARLESSTITNNGYGLFVSGLLIDTPQEDWYIMNMLIAYNRDGDCYDRPPFMPTAGHNLDSDGSCPMTGPGDLSDQDPALGALADNGGGTWTHKLLPPWSSNPAIDGGGSDCPSTDQRGTSRPQELDGDGIAECDIGAYEETELGFGAFPVEAATATPVEAPPPADPMLAKNAFCRKGPSLNYYDTTTLLAGQTAAAEGRNEDTSWLFVRPADGSEGCWVSVATLEPGGPWDGLPVAAAPLLPPSPEGLYLKHHDCTPNGFYVSIQWTRIQEGLSGYRVYRNGDLVDTLAAPKVSFEDNPPMQESLVYELATYNSNGVSDPVVLEVEGCF